MTAVFKFSEPTRAYTNFGSLWGGEISWYGWIVDIELNAKNRLGGYVGFESYIILFDDNEVFEVRESEILLRRLD